MVEILKEYLEKRLELLKLETSEKTSLGIGHLLFFSSVFIILSFFILILNLSIGFLIGNAIGNFGYGLLIVSGFYLLIILLLFVFRKKITESIANLIIKFLSK